MKLCECGCGTEIPTHRFPSQQARFVSGDIAAAYGVAKRTVLGIAAGDHWADA